MAKEPERADVLVIGGGLAALCAAIGQTLIVISDCGWVGREGGPVEEIRPGDVVWFSPGEKHWHGATATTALTHIAIQEALQSRRRLTAPQSPGWSTSPISNIGAETEGTEG